MFHSLERERKYVLSLFVIIMCSVMSLSAQSQNSGPAPSNSSARYEIDFMTSMIDHHTMAIDMAQICVQKAVHEQLRTLCQNIISAQTAEIQEMQTWLRDWYGITGYTPKMKPADMRMLDRLRSLSGAEFEIEFMKMMIKHHMIAIKEASTCVDRAYHEDLKDLCENIVTTQAAEIQQMKSWLCQWYGVCR